MKIYIAGDSTAATKEKNKRPEAGWGEYIDEYFDNRVTIINCAKNGRSTKSFLQEGLMQAILEKIQPGDYLFIQFGHNDQKLEDPQRGTHPWSDYQENLTTFIQLAKNQGAFPILLTSVTRRQYLTNGEFNKETLGDYPDAMKAVGKKLQIPILDIYDRTKKLYAQSSPEETATWHLHLSPHESENYPEGIEDNTHYNTKGAALIAKLIVEAIIDSSLLLKEYLR